MIRLINRKCPICNSDEFVGKPINSAVILNKFNNHNFIEKNWQNLASSQKPFF